MSPCVDIVLATYNGAAFIDEQLQSIRAQTHGDWRLLVRDDGSTDDTVEKVRRFAEANPGKVVLIDDGRGRLGVVANFGALLGATAAEYVALCDQDDVWSPRKLQMMLEAVAGERGPALVYSDLEVVDAGLRRVHRSFWAHQRVDVPGGERFSRLLLSNIAVGAATVVNRALLERALPIPPEAVMHDWWLALTSAAFGKLISVPTATVLYRQHGANQAGAHRYQPVRMIFDAVVYRHGRMRTTVAKTQRQAEAFARRYRAELPRREAELAERYGALGSMGPLERRAFLLGAGIHYRELARNLLLLAVA